MENTIEEISLTKEELKEIYETTSFLDKYVEVSSRIEVEMKNFLKFKTYSEHFQEYKKFIRNEANKHYSYTYSISEIFWLWLMLKDKEILNNCSLSKDIYEDMNTIYLAVLYRKYIKCNEMYIDTEENNILGNEYFNNLKEANMRDKFFLIRE